MPRALPRLLIATTASLFAWSSTACTPSPDVPPDPLDDVNAGGDAGHADGASSSDPDLVDLAAFAPYSLACDGQDAAAPLDGATAETRDDAGVCDPAHAAGQVLTLYVNLQAATATCADSLSSDLPDLWLTVVDKTGSITTGTYDTQIAFGGNPDIGATALLLSQGTAACPGIVGSGATGGSVDIESITSTGVHGAFDLVFPGYRYASTFDATLCALPAGAPSPTVQLATCP